MIMDESRVGRLTVLPTTASAPPHPRRGDDGVFTWLNLDGTLWGHGFRAGGERWLSLPGVGRFRLGEREAEATAVPDPGVALEQVVDMYQRCVVPMALHAQGFEVLHASAVVMDGGVVALCARAKTGKSTTAFALALRGHPLWADDSVAFQVVGGRPLAFPQPFRLRLRRHSGQFFDERVAPDAFSVMTEGSSGDGGPMPLAALVLLERGGDLPAPYELARVAPADALVLLMEHAYWYDLREAGRKRAMLDRYAQVLAATPVWRLTLRSELERLDDVADALQDALGSAAAA